MFRILAILASAIDCLAASSRSMFLTSLPVDFANIYLAPLIAEFARQYPGISFDFDLTPRLVDLVAEPFDVAIRMGNPPNSNMIARRLANLRCYFYASPRYLENFGEPVHPADLAQHECIGFKTAKANAWTLYNVDESIEVSVGGRFQLNSVGLIRRLAVLDLGITVLPEEIVAEVVDRGLLRRILPDWEGPQIPVYAMTETRLLPAKTQRFIDFLREQLGK